MILKASLLLVPALVAAMLAGLAYGNSGGRTDMQQAQAAGWDCNPVELILGYYHCAPMGGASVLDIATGRMSPPSVKLRVFNPDGSFAGTEMLRRADLHVVSQPCPQDNLARWDRLDLPVDYYACHHFDA